MYYSVAPNKIFREVQEDDYWVVEVILNYPDNQSIKRFTQKEPESSFLSKHGFDVVPLSKEQYMKAKAIVIAHLI